MNMYIFIVNPVSGNGKAQRIWKKVKQELEKKEVHYRSFFTKYRGHAQEIAEQIANLHEQKIAAIVSIGGDGTFHEMINGLTDYPELPVSCIPAGSGNDTCRAFSIPRSPLKALQQILQAEKRPIQRYDIGLYQLAQRRKGTGLFLNLGIGFDGEVAEMTNQAGYKKWLNRFKLGGLAYAISALRLIFTYQRKQMHLVIDGEEYTFADVWLVAITNIPYYGGGMKINPHAHPQDGKLNVCIVNNISPAKLLLVFGSVFWGWHSRLKGVTLLEGKEFQVRETEDGQAIIHADGEIIGQTPVSVSLHSDKKRIC